MKHLSKISAYSTLLFGLSFIRVLAQGNAPAYIRNDFFLFHRPANNVFNNLGNAVSIILPNVIVFAAVLFFFLILYGGLQEIVLGGQYNLSTQRVTQAKNMIYYGILGFLLTISAYFILQLVGTVIGIDFTNSPVT